MREKMRLHVFAGREFGAAVKLHFAAAAAAAAAAGRRCGGDDDGSVGENPEVVEDVEAESR